MNRVVFGLVLLLIAWPSTPSTIFASSRTDGGCPKSHLTLNTCRHISAINMSFSEERHKRASHHSHLPAKAYFFPPTFCLSISLTLTDLSAAEHTHWGVGEYYLESFVNG